MRALQLSRWTDPYKPYCLSSADGRILSSRDRIGGTFQSTRPSRDASKSPAIGCWPIFNHNIKETLWDKHGPHRPQASIPDKREKQQRRWCIYTKVRISRGKRPSRAVKQG